MVRWKTSQHWAKKKLKAMEVMEENAQKKKAGTNVCDKSVRNELNEERCT